MKVCLSGSSGRIGKELVSSILIDHDSSLVGGIVSENSKYENLDIGTSHMLAEVGVIARKNPEVAMREADIVIDFSRPSFALSVAEACRNLKKPMLIGTTGFQKQEMMRLEEIAKEIPIFISANMAFSVIVLAETAAKVAMLLGDDYDIEIIETHHNQKTDSPSGTALMVGRAILKAFGRNEGAFVFDRNGLREKGSIGFASIRAGGIIADIEVLFASHGEIITLKSSVLTRSVFANGALKAAKELVNMKPGKIYDYKDLYSF